MNLTEPKVEQKAAQYAKSLLKQAFKNEPKITEDLQKIVSEVAAELMEISDERKD